MIRVFQLHPNAISQIHVLLDRTTRTATRLSCCCVQTPPEFGPQSKKSEHSAHRIIKIKKTVSVINQVQIILSRAWYTQQGYEVHTAVRVAIDALHYEHNHDARTQSPRLSADIRQLSGDAGSIVETTKSSPPSAPRAWLRITREYTHPSDQTLKR